MRLSRRLRARARACVWLVVVVPSPPFVFVCVLYAGLVYHKDARWVFFLLCCPAFSRILYFK